MDKLQQFLSSEGVILLDGAMGTMLMMAGLESGAPPEGWNLQYPERIRQVHEAYIQAGSRIVLTNSFGGTRFRLKLHNLQEQVAELNRAAAEIARSAADAAAHTVLVGGSMGPTGELLEPMGTMTMDEAQAAFAEQAAALAAGGVDVLWIETMSDLNEVKAAVAGARSACDLPVVVSMTFDTHGRTMMGVSPEQAMRELGALNLSALGANCGNGPAEIEGVIQKMRAVAPDVALIAKSNAGIPHWEGEELVYDGTPQVMAGYTRQVRGLGAQLIGGCCGSTPEHIRAMREALDSAGDEVATAVPAAPPATEEVGMRDGRQRRRKRDQ